MSELEQIGESEFLKELKRLHEQRLGETDTNVRAMLDQQIAELMRAHARKADEQLGCSVDEAIRRVKLGERA